VIDISNRAEIVRWVVENNRPFTIVNDRGFQSLMKTGRPGYYLPSPSTVSRDVRQVFAHTRVRVAKMLQVIFETIIFNLSGTYRQKEYEVKLNFGTDAWTTRHSLAPRFILSRTESRCRLSWI
jgi:hypothetical protein